VMDTPSIQSSPPERSIQRPQHACAFPSWLRRPPDDLARKQVDADGQIAPAFGRGQLRARCTPCAIGRLHPKLAIQDIRGNRCIVLTVGRAYPLLASVGHQPGVTHQACHPRARAPFAALLEGRMHAGAAIRPSTGVKAGLYLGRQLLGALGVDAGRTDTRPRIVPTPGYPCFPDTVW
jgi:hypothetical protein